MTSVKRYGARGDGVTDDSLSFQLAFNQRRGVKVPHGNYRLASTVRFPIGDPAIAGMRIAGESWELVKLLPDPGVTALECGTGGRWPQVENLSIWGNRTQAGIFLGPHSCSRFRLRNIHFFNLSVGSDNRSPADEPAAYGSDAGGIDGCHYSYCDIGHRSFGNKDFTPIFGGSSLVDCLEAIRVESGGQVVMTGGVMANNRCHANIIEGSGQFAAVWFEGVQEGATCYVDTGHQSHAEFFGGHLQLAGPSVPFLLAQHSTGIHLGSNRGFSARINGSADVRGDGQEVDYNGVFKRRAGNYRIIGADSNPPAIGATMPDVTRYLIAAFGSVAFDRFVTCQQTGVDSGNPVFEWVDTLRREVLRLGSWVPL